MLGQYVKIDIDLSQPSKDDLIAFLHEFSNLFAWKPADMAGINPATICHYLAVDSVAKRLSKNDVPGGRSEAKLPKQR